MDRPKGSNADEWVMFLTYWLGDNDVTPFLAIQICEAIEAKSYKPPPNIIDGEGWEPSSGMAAIALAPIGSEPDDNGWLPIDTYNLPDDTPVLVWDGEWQSVAHCSTHKNNKKYWYINNSYGFNEDGQIYGVTHWQPLPKTT